jgi:hypothetical protein
MRRFAYAPLRLYATARPRNERRSHHLSLGEGRPNGFLGMIYKREGIIVNGTNKRMVRIRQMLNIRFIRSLRSYSRYFHFAKRQRDCHDPARAAGSRNDDVMDVISERRALALWSYSL